MIRHKLRHLVNEDINKIIAQNYWCSIGRDVGESMPLPECDLIEFETNTGWGGMIDASHWYNHFLAIESVLNYETWRQQEINEFFYYCSLPLNMPYEEYCFSKIICSKIINLTDANKKPLLSIDTSQGKVWITKFPISNYTLYPNKIPESLISSLSLLICLTLGMSRISAKLLNKLNVGDALLLKVSVNELVLGETILGRYKIKGNHVMLENEKDYLQSDNNSEEASIAMQEKIDGIPVNDLPITLTYILQQRTISVGELQDFFKGMVLPCEEDNYKKIAVQANGVTLAHGELIWLEEQPAILINHLEDGHALK